MNEELKGSSSEDMAKRSSSASSKTGAKEKNDLLKEAVAGKTQLAASLAANQKANLQLQREALERKTEQRNVEEKQT